MKTTKLLGVLGALVLLGCASDGGPGGGGGGFAINVLSSRPDMVSGGDALVEVRGGAGTAGNDITLTLNGAAIHPTMTAGLNAGDHRALISGLVVGKNVLSATAKGRTARVTLTNYPITGPIFSGPHMNPYECRTEQSGLGKATDANCSAPTKVEYFYRSTGGTFKPLPANYGPFPNGRLESAIPPLADLARTTTITGETVPYIVRVESGTINRTIYRMAILDDPATPSPHDGWNGRLGVSFGGGAGAAYNQGANQSSAALNDLFLSRGFAHIAATELVNGLHGNGVLQAESLMMIKEKFIEEFGPPKWTVGSGGSGGAIQQLVITQAYPGLLDGLQPSLSFPDSTLHVPDCGLLQRYFTANAAAWPAAKQQAVIGFSIGTGSTCASWNTSFVPVSRSNNKPGCQLSNQALVYDKVTNPTGARCALQDMRVNIYGRNAQGYAPNELDNVGLQYGLGALNDGKISVDDFLDLNEKIGGFDKDGDYVAQREVGEIQAIRANYRSGLLNSGGGGLANVPIIQFRTYNDARGDIHSRERDLVIRARLDKANGRHDNQVIWVAPTGAPAAAAAGAGRGGAAAAPAAGRGGAAAAAAPAAGRGGQAAAGRGGAGRGGAAAPAGPAPVRDAPGAGPLNGVAPNPPVASQVLDTMTRWLDAIAADPAPLSTDKVVRHKPADAVDAYWDLQGRRVNEVANTDPNTGYNRTYPLHTEPRIVAGAPWTVDVLKCQLKRINMADYHATFTAEQEARLRRVFPDGVCDFTKRGVGEVAFGGVWQRY